MNELQHCVEKKGVKKNKLIVPGILIAAALAFSGTARGDQAPGFNESTCSGGALDCSAARHIFDQPSASPGFTLDSLVGNLNGQVMSQDLGFKTSAGLLDPLDFAGYLSAALNNLGCNTPSACASGPGGPGTFPGAGGTGPGGGKAPVAPTSEPAAGLLAMLGLALMGLSFVLQRSHT